MNIIKRSFLFPVNEIKKLYLANSKEVPMLNGIRAISCLMIIMYHCFILLFMVLKDRTPEFINTNIPSFFTFLLSFDKSVDVFFILSAFLITRHLLDEVERKESIDLISFYKRRLYRVYPLFFVALCIYSLMYLNHLTVGKLAYNLSFLGNTLGYTIIPVGWTLDIEMQFYLLIPLFVYFIHKTKAYFTIPLLLLISVVIRYKVGQGISNEALEVSTLNLLTSKHYKSFMHGLYYPTYSRFGSLIIGIIWAYVDKFYRGKVKIGSLFSYLIFFIALSALIFSINLPIFHTKIFGLSNNIHVFSWHRLIFSLSFVSILILCDFNLISKKIIKLIKGTLELKFWRVFSQLSYSIYLFHFPIVAISYVLVFQTTNPKNITTANIFHVFLAFIITTALSTYLSIFMYKYIEVPFIKKGKHVHKQKNNLVIN